MPIPIQCPNCGKQYKVNDALAGKKVKCRECGEQIPVAMNSEARDPDVFGVEDTLSDSGGTRAGSSAGSKAGSRAPSTTGPSVRRCPSCRTPNPPTASVCSACGYVLEGGGAGSPEESGAGGTFGVAGEGGGKKKRRFVRDPGSPMLNQIDSLLSLIVWWGSIAAVAVWVVHIGRSPEGISVGTLLPLGFMLVVIALIAAPLVMISIKVTAKYADFIPRDDVYNRALISLLVPFSASLVTGWPGFENPLITTAGWIAAPVLFVYLFRGEVVEWVASVIAGGAGALVGWWLAGLIAVGVASAMGPMYADMLPAGPWLSFATGHSPPPTPVTTEPAVANGTPGSPAATEGATGTTQKTASFLTSANPDGTGNTAENQTATLTQGPTAQNHQTGRNSGTPGSVAPLPTVLPAVQDSYFAEMEADDPGLAGIREVTMPVPPATWFLVVKGGDGGAVDVERWSLLPPTKKGTLTFSELPGKPNSYALSPKGDVLAALVHFPKDALHLASFDNKNVKDIPLDVPGATGTFIGFTDSGHFAIRWEMGGVVKVQIWNTFNASLSRTITPERPDSDTGFIFSPNGRVMATTGRSTNGEQQLVLYNSDTGMIMKHITPTTSTFQLNGLAFSPDSMQIGMCATISNVQTLFSFKVATGAPTYSGMLPNKGTAMESGANKGVPGLLWLQNGLAWLVDGNDLYDATTGAKIGSLQLPAMVNEGLVGPDSIVLTQQLPDGTKKAIMARFDDAKFKRAGDMAK